ncbi:hypothetical protein CEE45_12820 [Candidatus Heimdallarchaeota archaeon B3_Heim]|nr:MAG: hypothetical protein CEE45_12820 [Candidatus Heimdallarchaeota archaeon B3_Heim]
MNNQKRNYNSIKNWMEPTLSLTRSGNKISHKLKFTPSLDEQILLAKIQRQNCLIQYRLEEKLNRILSLLISLHISREKTHESIPRVLILTKRQIQDIFRAGIQDTLNQIITIHNGLILPQARKLDYSRFSIILSTPKTVKNDFKEDFFVKDHFSLIVIDYAEMGVSSSTLRFIIKKLKPNQVVGLSREKNTIKLGQACVNLELTEFVNIDGNARRERSNIQYYSLPLPKEYFFVLDILNQLKKNRLIQLEKLGFGVTVKSTPQEVAAIHTSLLNEKNRKLLVKTANLQRIMTMQRMVISQGFPALISYFDDICHRLNDNDYVIGRKALVQFLGNPIINKLNEYVRLFSELVHPKFRQVLKLLEDYGSSVSLVTNNRYNAKFLQEKLNEKGVSTINITQPISSLKRIQLEKKLFAFSGKKTRVCITNTANELIANLAWF